MARFYSLAIRRQALWGVPGVAFMPQMKISCFEDQLQLSTRWLEMAALGWSLCCCVHSILCHLLESIRFPAMLEVRGQLPAMRLWSGWWL